MRFVQLELSLRLPDKVRIAAALKACMLCEHYKLSLPGEACVARQTGQPAPRTVGGTKKIRIPDDPFCRSGKCRQGIAVLLRERLVARARCPTCTGGGWVVREAPSHQRTPTTH